VISRHGSYNVESVNPQTGRIRSRVELALPSCNVQEKRTFRGKERMPSNVRFAQAVQSSSFKVFCAPIIRKAKFATRNSNRETSNSEHDGVENFATAWLARTMRPAYLSYAKSTRIDLGCVLPEFACSSRGFHYGPLCCIDAPMDLIAIVSLILAKEKYREGADEVAFHVRDRCGPGCHDLR
jgi:hypothetical protein